MYYCEICNKEADIHHIVHRSEGGFDMEINYMYLCEEHHRGKNGPHHSLETDLIYKIRLQKKLYKILPKRYYSFKELSSILNISSNITKRITKDIKLYKEGYRKDDIILKIMGGSYYEEELLENLKLEKLYESIY
ncbi:MAG: HNH endonuclease [Clostridium baratii]|uniref:HNH endonuclease n=1 Tax=Clostridium baratii str. Sullivan TaxID=1415775 RepID=A0A0A7FX19_9CLOT|nr:HNH endonuclease signature motif containing protein [Clostridium baratii]AIY84133.1 hypothetical protein U729_1447 [Clostridium baratii str. Sullivan]MBS6007443.1 HNH endonuclease [Clostridium baratii]MDU1054798.1 HNH endonuclease signature motif containing protein [Clostridium baratii]MDU4911929.1 HNH endonuclease signature motif containing protein [Clostridium baratii]CUP67331.1 phage protein [Clostridium baratii]